jgi:hypothetical protein
VRLRDLDGRFIYDADVLGYSQSDSDSVEGAQGVVFQCPKCGEGCEPGEEDGRRFLRGAHYIRVFFANPAWRAVAPPEADKNPRWHMVGTSIDDLTLSPSVDCTKGGGCSFHGWVLNGEAA